MRLDRYGYAKCMRCGSLRPASALVSVSLHAQGATVARVECADTGYCTRAAGVGLGAMDGGSPRGPQLNAEMRFVGHKDSPQVVTREDSAHGV